MLIPRSYYAPRRSAMKNISRRTVGATLAELPLALLIVLIFGGFPFIALCSITLRSTFVHLASFEAARAAAAARTFQTSEAGYGSAVREASEKVSFVLDHFSGIKLLKQSGQVAKTVIVVTELKNPQNTQTFESPLPPPVLTNKYLYQYQVTVKGEVEPIVHYSGGLLGNIPGFSAPIPVTVTSTAFCENPGGLIQ